MNFVPNDNSEDEFLCIWFVVSFIYVLHGDKNIFIVIVIALKLIEAEWRIYALVNNHHWFR